MKLNDIQDYTLKELQDELVLVSYIIGTDETGKIKSLNVKYIPSEECNSKVRSVTVFTKNE